MMKRGIWEVKKKSVRMLEEMALQETNCVKWMMKGRKAVVVVEEKARIAAVWEAALCVSLEEGEEREGMAGEENGRWTQG